MTAHIANININHRSDGGARDHYAHWVVADNLDSSVRLSGRVEDGTLRGCFEAAEAAGIAACAKLNRMTAAQRAHEDAQAEAVRQAAAQQEQ